MRPQPRASSSSTATSQVEILKRLLAIKLTASKGSMTNSSVSHSPARVGERGGGAGRVEYVGVKRNFSLRPLQTRPFPPRIPDAAILKKMISFLAGGPSPDKRLRQVHDATEYIRKEMNKLQPAKSAGGGKKGAKVDAPASASTAAALPTPAVVICGDFNEEGSTAVKMLLCEGLVPADYTQESIVITSKPKKQELGAFKDAHAEIYAASAIPTSRPPTLICPNLVEHFLLPCDGPAAPG
jgi:hypothetical protein